MSTLAQRASRSSQLNNNNNIQKNSFHQVCLLTSHICGTAQCMMDGIVAEARLLLAERCCSWHIEVKDGTHTRAGLDWCTDHTSRWHASASIQLIWRWWLLFDVLLFDVRLHLCIIWFAASGRGAAAFRADGH